MKLLFFNLIFLIYNLVQVFQFPLIHSYVSHLI